VKVVSETKLQKITSVKNLVIINTLAYIAVVSVKKIKSFITLTLGH
jgi:hypothetical protein